MATSLLLGVGLPLLAQPVITSPPATVNPICAGDSNGSIRFQMPSDTLDYFFDWNGGNAQTGLAQGLFHQEGLIAGTYTVYILDFVTFRDTTVTVTLTAPNPILVSAGQDIRSCVGLPVRLSGTSSTPGTFTWRYIDSAGTARTLNGQNVNIPVSGSGSLGVNTSTTITLTVVTAAGCSGTDEVKVSVNPIPVANFIFSRPAICQGQDVSVQFSGSASPDAIYSWILVGGGGTFLTSGSISATGIGPHTITFSQPGVGTPPQRSVLLRVTEPTNTGSGSCQNNRSNTVIVQPTPVLSITGLPGQICVNGTPQSLAGLPAGGVFIGPGMQGTTFNPTLAGIGTHAIWYRYSSTAGCLDSIQAQVRVFAKPILSVTGLDTAYCESADPAHIAALPLNGILTGPGINASTFTPRSAGIGTHTVRYYFADTNGCADSTRLTVRVKANPTVQVSPDSQAICEGAPAVFGLSSLNPGASISYTATGTVNVSGYAGGTGFAISQTLTGAGKVTYRIKATLQGCESPESRAVAVVSPKPAIVLGAAQTLLCSGDTGMFTVQTLPAEALVDLYVDDLLAQGSLPSGGSVRIPFTNSAASDRIVAIKAVARLNGCTGDSSTSLITIKPQPQLAVVLNRTDLCQGDTLRGSLAATPAGSTTSWVVESVSGNISGQGLGIGSTITQALTSTDSLPGSVTYRFSSVSANGCKAKDSLITVRVQPIPRLRTIDTALTYCNGASVVLNTLAGNPVRWFRNGSEVQVGTLNTLTVDQPGAYNVQVTNTFGCMSTSAIWNVTEAPLPVLKTITGPASLCLGATGELTYSDTNRIQWYRNGAMIQGATGTTLTVLDTGVYHVIVTTARQCSDTSATFTIFRQVAPFSGTATITNPTCTVRGSILVALSGVTTDVGIDWTGTGTTDNSFTQTGLEAGTFSYVLRDTVSGCRLPAETVNLTFRDSISYALQVLAQPNCLGMPGSAQIVVADTTGLRAEWLSSANAIVGTGLSVTGLLAGGYTVNLSRGVCADTASFNLTSTNDLNLSVLANAPVPCLGIDGSAILFVDSARVQADSIAWKTAGGARIGTNDDTIRNLAPGTYRVVAFRTGCVDSTEFSIAVPDNFILQVSSTASDCGDTTGSAGASVTGATSPTVAWLRIDGATLTPVGSGMSIANLGGGRYMAVAVEGTCSDTARFDVADSLRYSVTVQQPLGCGVSPGSARIFSTSTALSVIWKNEAGATISDSLAAVNLAPGAYRFFLTQAACIDSGLIQISAPPQPGLTVSSVPVVGCDSANGQVSAQFDPAATFVWQAFDRGTWTAIGTTATIDSLPVGFYRVLGTMGTCVDTAEVTLAKPAGCDTACTVRLVVSSNPVTCQGGTDGQALALVTSGGSGRYQFRINSLSPWVMVDSLYYRFQNLPQGPFTIDVRDGLDTACMATGSQNIGSRIALVVQPSVLPAPCGSSAQLRLQVFGGNSPYILTDSTTGNSFSFDGDTTFALASGIRKMTIADSNGCVSQPISITIPGAGMSPIRLSAIAAQCFGSATGGFHVDTLPVGSTLQYKIGNTAYTPLVQGNTYSGMRAGTYTVLIRDAATGCIADTTITIAQPEKLGIQASIGAQPSCGRNDGVILIDTLTGGNGFFRYHLTNASGSRITATLPYPDSATVRSLEEGIYGIVVADTLGCRDSLDITLRSVTVEAAVAIIPSSAAICTGQEITFRSSMNVAITSPLYQWYVNSLPIATATADTFATSTLQPGDTIQVTVFSSQVQACVTGLPARSPITVIQAIPAGSAPNVSIAPPAIVCQGQPVTIKANLAPPSVQVRYSFYRNDTLVQQDTASRYVYTMGLMADTIYVIAKLDSGLTCLTRLADTSAAVIVNPLANLAANALIAVGDTMLCRGSAQVITVQTNIANLPGLRYQWYRNGRPIVGATGSTYAAQDTAAGTHTYTVWLSSDQNPGCVTGLPFMTQEVRITVRPRGDAACNPCALRLSIDTIIHPTCAGQLNGEIHLKATGGSGTYLYKTMAGPRYSTTHQWLGMAPGIYNYVVRDSLKVGCADTLSSIQLMNRLQITASVVGTRPTVCGSTNNGVINITSVSGGYGPYLFRIRNIDTMAANSQYTGLSAGNYNITVLDDSTNCMAFIPYQLEANPALDIRGRVVQTPRCYGERSGVIRIDTVLNGRNGYTYSLIGPDTGMNPLTPGTTLISGLRAGTHTVFVRDAAGCVVSKQYTITQPDTLLLTATTTGISDCASPTGAARINVLSGGTAPYTFAILRPGSARPDTVAIPTDSLLRSLSSGDYRLLLTDSLGCSAQTSFRIESGGPRATRVLGTNACPGGSNGMLTIQGATGGLLPYSFEVSRADGFQRTQPDSVFTQLTPGVYTVTVRDASMPACTASYTRELRYSDTLKATIVSFTPSTCDNPDGAAIFRITGGYPGYQYSFDRTLGVPTPFQAFDGDTLRLTSLTARMPGMVFTVELKDNSPGNGCEARFTFIQPGNAPLTYALQSLEAPCANQHRGAVRLVEMQGTGPVVVRVFDATTGTLVKTDSVRDTFFRNSSWTVDSLAEGVYNVQVQQYGNCSASRTEIVEISARPQIVAHYRNTYASTPSFAEGEIELDSITGGVKPYAYEFDKKPVEDFPGSVWFNKLMPGMHELIVIDSLGCRVRFDIDIERDSVLTLTNVFTPNGDGVNDTWIVKNLPAGSAVKVFNRWGKVVYESKDYKNDWDGGVLPQGTYLYSIHAPDGRVLNGWLDLVRLSDKR